MTNFVASKKHSSMVKIEKVPGFYTIYRNIFLKIICKTDLQKSNQEKGKNYFNVPLLNAYGILHVLKMVVLIFAHFFVMLMI